MKYVMINHRHPIIFPNGLVHCMFKEVGKITSAGFVSFDKEGIRTHGNSASLKKLAPEEGDNFILAAFIKGYSQLLDILNIVMVRPTIFCYDTDIVVNALAELERREEKYKDETA